MVNNRVCIILGCGDAVCAWSAKEMAKNGYVTAIVSKDIDSIKKMADEICTFGGLAKAYSADCSDISSLAMVRDMICAEFGRCSVIVNCVSNANEIVYIEAGMRTFLNGMSQEYGCCVVNICPANICKDIAEMTKNIAVKFACDNIRVNAIVYGELITKSNRNKYYDESNEPTAEYDEAVKKIPMMRLCKPEEIVGALKYFSDSISASYTTGNVIYIDGGCSAAND